MEVFSKVSERPVYVFENFRLANMIILSFKIENYYAYRLDVDESTRIFYLCSVY